MHGERQQLRSDVASAGSERAEPCSGCGLVVGAGTTGCQAILDELLARDFSDVAYFLVHRLMVDTYALQHPDRYCVSAKSLAAHLTGLCWILEHGGSPAVGSESLRRWLDGAPRIERPEPPSFRGGLTIADVREARDPENHAARAVQDWARSTWDAYASLHALAGHWVEQALSGQRLPSR
jgi:hypothetical protein